MDWIGGIDILPGLRVIPESKLYSVRATHRDLVVTTTDGRYIYCTLVNKFYPAEVGCFNLDALCQRLAQRVDEQTGMKLITVAFLGTFGFPEHQWTVVPVAAI